MPGLEHDHFMRALAELNEVYVDSVARARLGLPVHSVSSGNPQDAGLQPSLATPSSTATSSTEWYLSGLQHVAAPER